jgi:hypothetical protein
MFDWLNVLVQQERCKDFLREAEHHRQVRQVMEGRESHDHVHCRALIWLGRQLVAWGLSIQTRHGVALKSCPSPAINHPQ